MKDFLTSIVQHSLGSAPEDMLRISLHSGIELTGASGGSILGEEGPYLQFLFSDLTSLIGKKVPYESIAGSCIRNGHYIYTFAPSDKRHYHGVDQEVHKETRYLLSIPIPSILPSTKSAQVRRNAGVMQLLFEENIMPEYDPTAGAVELDLESFSANPVILARFQNIFILLPMIAFGMEVMSLRQTSYQVIHELKNKMISSASWINNLHDDIEASTPAALEQTNIKEDFELAETAIKEGAELAKNYLQFTKLYTPVFQDTDINAVLAEAAAAARALGQKLGMNGLDVELIKTESPCNRMADPGQLKIVFFNLCKNALEAMAVNATSDPRLVIKAEGLDSRLAIHIADNGPGMPPEIADNLFVPFKTKKEGGTGLGLTIVKKIIDIHGGVISCSSSEDGTKFAIIM